MAPHDDSEVEPSSAPPKKARTKKRKDGHPEVMPGKSEDTKSFIGKLSWEGEGLCAGYLGFKTIADLRRFAMSPWTLKFFNEMEPDRQKARVEKILEILRDYSEDMRSDADPVFAFPSDHPDNFYPRVALIIAQATREIQNARFKTLPFT